MKILKFGLLDKNGEVWGQQLPGRDLNQQLES